MPRWLNFVTRWFKRKPAAPSKSLTDPDISAHQYVWDDLIGRQTLNAAGGPDTEYLNRHGVGYLKTPCYIDDPVLETENFTGDDDPFTAGLSIARSLYMFAVLPVSSDRVIKDVATIIFDPKAVPFLDIEGVGLFCDGIVAMIRSKGCPGFSDPHDAAEVHAGLSRLVLERADAEEKERLKQHITDNPGIYYAGDDE